MLIGESGPSSLSPRSREYRQVQGSPRATDGSKYGRTNGQRAGSATPSVASSSGGGKDSPSRSITSRSSNSRNTPTGGKMITREDLRRMNSSHPSTKKKTQPTSYSLSGFWSIFIIMTITSKTYLPFKNIVAFLSACIHRLLTQSIYKKPFYAWDIFGKAQKCLHFEGFKTVFVLLFYDIVWKMCVIYII